MFTLTSVSSSARSSAIRSRTGAIAWHGPHHSAQKSTITGFSLCSTCSSNVVSVTTSIVNVLCSLSGDARSNDWPRRKLPASNLESSHGPRLRAACACPRSSRARAEGARLVGARTRLRRAPRAEPRRPALQLHRRARHGEQDARRAHGVGEDAEGRLPALQGVARLRPALPERLRLPGALDRGRGRARPRPELEARDRGVRARPLRGEVP